VRWDLRSRGS